MAQVPADTTHHAEKVVLSTRNDLGVEVREKATALLNQHLADATDLYSQTKQAHWNVKGCSSSNSTSCSILSLTRWKNTST